MDLNINKDVLHKLNALKSINDPNIARQDKESLFISASQDDHFEIRETVAQMLHVCPTEGVIDRLLKDSVPQVRIAIINNSVQIRKAMNNDFILVKLEGSIRDSVSEVRIALANIIHQHAFLTPDSQISKLQAEEKLIEAFTRTKLNEIFLFKGLLLDPNDDVRISASNNYRHFVIIHGFDFVFVPLFNSLHLMFIDSQWRVRTIAAELVFGLANFSPPDFFDECLYQFLERFLTDPCQKVRDYAISSLPTLVEHFCYRENGENDMSWLMKSLIKKLEITFFKDDSYISKQTYLFCLAELASYIPVQHLRTSLFLPLIRILKETGQNDNVIIVTLDILVQLKDSIHPYQKNYELKPILNGLHGKSTPTIKSKIRILLDSF